MSGELFVVLVAVVGLVIVISTVLSGFLDRTGVPQAAMFLLVGLILGPSGLRVLDVGLETPMLRVVAVLSLVLVLFTDALGLDKREVGKHLTLAARVLGPGTLISAAVTALLAVVLLGLPLAEATIVGAALASTDPVLLRRFLRRDDVPRSARVALRLESGLNDVVLLPIVLVSMALLPGAAAPAWGKLALEVVIIGPVAGIIVALVGIGVLELMRRRAGIRRDYESLYSLGIAFTAFAAAEALHGSGFLAAFAAGLTIVILDVELCDCFLEYGETTAEMALLFAFVLFGTSLVWSGLSGLDVKTVIFAVLVILARPAIMMLSLLGSPLGVWERLLVAWFGPRGLSTLLLILLPVFAGLPGAGALFRLCSVVVLLSVVLHGTTLAIVGRQRAPRVIVPLTKDRVTMEELERLGSTGDPIMYGDVRTPSSAAFDTTQIAGAVRLDPRHVVRDATALDLPKDAWIGLYCA
jgi:sodium/hydrogen antiporter